MEINDDNATERYRQIAQEAHDDAMMYRDKLEAAELRIAELEQSLKRQAKAAISGMDAAKAVASSNLEHATRLRAESSPETLESERAANALLTERVAELEEREQALAAQFVALQDAATDLIHASSEEDAGDAMDRIGDCSEKQARDILSRRDALKQAEALEHRADCIMAEAGYLESFRREVAGLLRADAGEKRRQTEA